MSTIYINNLNEKVSVNTLKKELQMAFKPYNVIEIHLKKSLKKKGQAFISFKNEDINKIIKKYNNYKLLDKPMKVTKAKEDSYELLSKDTIEKRINTKKYKIASIPNNTLLIQGMGEALNKEELDKLFESLVGFITLRLIPVKNLLFVEFETVEDSKACFENVSLDDLKRINANISFAK